MLDVGWSEILVIAIVMIVVVGPKDLPKMLRAFGKATTRMRTTANEFKRQFDDALKEAELDDVKTIIDETRKLDPRGKMTKVFDPIRSAGNDLKTSLNQSPKPQQPAKPAKSSVTKDDTAEVAAKEGEPQVASQDASIETKTPSDAIAEAVKKNLPDGEKAETVQPVKAKNTVKKTAPATAPTAKVTRKPAAKATVAKTATAQPAPKKPAAKKTPASKNSAKKPAAKTTGTNE